MVCHYCLLHGLAPYSNFVGGCPYNHDVGRFDPQGDTAKRFLTVDSPSFTPLAPVTNTQSAQRAAGISPKAATAAIFTPKGAGKILDALNCTPMPLTNLLSLSMYPMSLADGL